MQQRPNYMPPELFNQVLDAIPTLHIRKWKDEDVKMLFKNCYWIELRIGEAIKLTVEDFDLQRLRVYLGKTKANKNDEAVIPPDYKSELEIYLLGKKGPLLPGLSYPTVLKWINRLGEALDIKAWTTPQSETGEKTKSHIFRKSMAKDLLYGTYGSKATVNVISQSLRHKGKNPLATTFHYLKMSGEDLDQWWSENRIKKDDS